MNYNRLMDNITRTIDSHHCRLGLFERAAAGRFALSPKFLAKQARSPSLGVRGETLAHWIFLHGNHRQMLAWIEAGGPAARDERGALPIHWMASMGPAGMSGRAWALAKHSKKIKAWLEPQVGELDAFGRDALGLMCARFGWAGAAAVWSAFPEQARRGASLGAGPMSVGSMLVALGWRLRERGSADAGASGLAEALDDSSLSPSLELPQALRSREGLWTPQMWPLGLNAGSSPRLRGVMEAAAIDAQLGPSAPSTSVPARL